MENRIKLEVKYDNAYDVKKIFIRMKKTFDISSIHTGNNRLVIDYDTIENNPSFADWEKNNEIDLYVVNCFNVKTAIIYFSNEQLVTYWLASKALEHDGKN